MRSKNRRVLVLAVSAAMLSAMFSMTAEAAVIMVSSGNDGPARSIVCGSTFVADGCTLREAINFANANGSDSHDEIHFSLPNPSAPLNLLTELPALVNVTLDGTTQPDFVDTPLVTIDGTFMTSPTKRALILGGNATVKSVRVRKASDGISIIAEANAVEGCEISENAGAGITIISADNNRIGGASATLGNVVSRNGLGIFLNNARANIIIGNEIGSNSSDGLRLIGSTSSRNYIGGAEAGEGNIITANGKDGIVLAGAGHRNPISANFISQNAEEGIDLMDDGVTLNDEDELSSTFGVDNAAQNFPVISSAVSACETTVTGTLNSSSALLVSQNDYRIEFFSNLHPDFNVLGIPRGGEGETYLGAVMVTADAGGDASFTASFTPAELSSEPLYITATATSGSGSTSEFSRAKIVTQSIGEFALMAPPSLEVPESAGELLVSLTKKCGLGAADITVTTSDGNAVAGSDYTSVSQTIHYEATDEKKEFLIPILNDSSAESPETFTVTLSNPTNGATLGENSQLTYTIVDDDTNPSGGAGGDTSGGSGSSGGCSLIR